MVLKMRLSIENHFIASHIIGVRNSILLLKVPEAIAFSVSLEGVLTGILFLLIFLG